MNRRFLIFVLALACLVGFTTTSQAQSPVPNELHPMYHSPTLGSMWGFAKFYTGEGKRWPELAEANPQIPDPNFILPTDVLRTPRKWQDEFGLPEILGPKKVEVKTGSDGLNRAIVGLLGVVRGLPWMQIFIGVALLFLIYLVLTEFRLFRPVSGGRPLVPGGLRTERASLVMDQRRRLDLRRNEQPVAPGLRILNIVAVPLWGVAMARYEGDRWERRVLSGQRGYRATWSDGHIEYCLQACGNDLRFGSIRWEGTPSEIPLEAAAMAQAPAVGTPTPEANPVASVSDPTTTTIQPAVVEGVTRDTLSLMSGIRATQVLDVQGFDRVAITEDGEVIGLQRLGKVQVAAAPAPEVRPAETPAAPTGPSTTAT